MRGANDLRLRWVLADPARERAVDPLGMGAQADRLSDLLLPQLSVTTLRARYFSFLCWAVSKARSTAKPTNTIHRLEAELAIEEAIGHRDDPPDQCPGIVGRTRARAHLERTGKPPARPERLYKTMAFAAYRPAMTGIGLLERGRQPVLTAEGRRVASAFEAARGRKPRCLSDISNPEQVRLRVLLGLDYRRKNNLSPASERRRATFDAIHRLLAGQVDSARILEHHASLGRRVSDVASILHRAFVWELLSTGLATGFSMLLERRRKGVVVRSLRAGLGGRPQRPSLFDVGAAAPDGGQVVALLRAALRLRPDTLGLEPAPVRLAARLVADRDPDAFVRGLIEQHRAAKAGEPWIALSGDKVEALVPKKALAFRVRSRNYRLDAFGQLVYDLGMLP